MKCLKLRYHYRMHCRKVIEDCKSAKNPKAYRIKHQAEYQLHDSLKKSFKISVSPKSQALIKHRNGLKILNLNRLLLSGKSRNYRKSRRHWISSDRISQHCLMLLKYQTTISLVPLHPLFNISVCNVLRRIIQEN